MGFAKRRSDKPGGPSLLVRRHTHLVVAMVGVRADASEAAQLRLEALELLAATDGAYTGHAYRRQKEQSGENGAIYQCHTSSISLHKKRHDITSGHEDLTLRSRFFISCKRCMHRV